MRVTTALNFRIIDGERDTSPHDFETAAPQTVLKWALDEFGSDVALATGFGTEGCILVDMVARIDPSARIFYLDTDLLFPETYELRDRLAERYGVHFERRSAARSVEQQALRHGDKLWERDPDPDTARWAKTGRQFAVVDAQGNVAAYTGPTATDWAGDRQAPYVFLHLAAQFRNQALRFFREQLRKRK